MGSKIGKQELEIVERLQDGEQSRAQLLVDFAPKIISPNGRVNYQYSVVRDRLRRMAEKGLIVIEDGRVRLGV